MHLTNRSAGQGASCSSIGVPGTGVKTIALAGNPNVGKSTLFNALTGLRQHTGNWPGKTVEAAAGSFTYKGAEYALVDLPGTYSLLAHSPEEAAARDYILSGKADAVVVVCDALCLERNLNLVFQVMEICPRTAVCVNLLDEAERKGVSVDIPLLSELLGIPTVGVVGRKKRTLPPLLACMEAVCGDENKRVRTVDRSKTDDDWIIAAMMEKSAATARAVTRHTGSDRPAFDRRVDALLTGRRAGSPLMALLLGLLLWITIRGANYPSRLLSGLLFSLGDRLSALLLSTGAPIWLHDALILGVYRMLAWVVSVMLPPMAIFFPLFTFLEDVGILPRIAFNLDRPFCRCRACGKQALTMSMGFGCNAAGIVGCRIIDSPRERLLAILTNSFVPCNGRFPILITLLTLFFAAGSSSVTALLLTGLLLLSVLVTFCATRLLSATVLRGEPSFYTLELPAYRRPQLGQILVRSVFDRTVFVLGRAAAVAAPAGLVIWCLANVSPGGVSLLSRTASFLEPAGRLLGMDGVILLAFLLGWPANETVIPIMLMIYLSRSSLSCAYSMEEIRSVLAASGWTASTAGCVLLFTLMHWPCSTTVLTVYKETKSMKWTAVSVLLPAAFGGASCLLLRGVSSLFGF